MEIVTLTLVMLLVVVLSSIITRALPVAVPMPLVQIVLGAGIAMTGHFSVRLDPELFFLLFLPPLLFVEGWRISKQKVFRDKWTILEMALGLVFFTVVGMAFFIHWLIPAMPLVVAFALAAVLSPTDPVAVSAIAARVPIPKRVMHILEGESLLNDASGLVCLRFAIAAAITGSFSLSQASEAFIWLALSGVACGMAVTAAVVFGKKLIAGYLGEDSGAQILISLLIPFASYLSAEHIGGSGILAAVAGGVTMSYAETTGRALAITRIHRNVVWDTLQFTVNGIVFVLLGEQLPLIVKGAYKIVKQTGHDHLLWLFWYVAVITLMLIVLRFVWVWTSVRFTMIKAAKRGETRVPTPIRMVAVMSLAGVRGAITLAGIMTLPLLMPDGTNFPARDLAIFLAAGVIILSLLIATFLLPPLLRGVTSTIPDTDQDEHEDRARQAAAWAAIRAIENEQFKMAEGRSDADLYANAASRVMDLYRSRLEDGAKSGNEKQVVAQSLEIERKLRIAALQGERDEIFRLARARQIGDDVMRKMVNEIDLAETREQQGLRGNSH